MVKELTIQTPGRGLHEITGLVAEVVADATSNDGLVDGLCTVFIRHTSASLTIQENADPSARLDLEAWFNRQIPDGDPVFTHDSEGPDDMPAHIRAALTDVSLSIPVLAGRLALGVWQGVYIFEHRRRPYARRVVVHVG